MKKLYQVFAIILSVLTVTTVSLANETNAQAASPKSATTITEIYSTPINDKVTIDFVDESLVGTKKLETSSQSGVIAPMGVITEVYHHSYYGIRSYSRTGQAVGPRMNEVTYASLARGETRTVTDTTTLTGTVTISGTYNVNAINLVKASISGSVSGSISHTWSTTTTLTGPNAPYNTRLYSHAVDFDQYSYILNKYDVYYIYNNGSYYSEETYNGGTVTMNAVKKPIFVSYSTDRMY